MTLHIRILATWTSLYQVEDQKALSDPITIDSLNLLTRDIKNI